MDSAGVVYVADTISDTIRKITPGGVVTTLAGFYGSLGAVDGIGRTARFAYPMGSRSMRAATSTSRTGPTPRFAKSHRQAMSRRSQAWRTTPEAPMGQAAPRDSVVPRG